MPFVKGQSGNPAGKKPGTKARKTLEREERRRVFDEAISQRWIEVIQQLPPQYIADQFLGKAPDKIDLTTKDQSLAPSIDLDALAVKMAKELKERKT